MSYRITLTEEDCGTIAFIGDRYNWSAWAERLAPGENVLAESEAWEFQEAIEEDTLGGHARFPMLDPRSDLCARLDAFSAQII